MLVQVNSRAVLETGSVFIIGIVVRRAKGDALTMGWIGKCWRVPGTLSNTQSTAVVRESRIVALLDTKSRLVVPEAELWANSNAGIGAVVGESRFQQWASLHTLQCAIVGVGPVGASRHTSPGGVVCKREWLLRALLHASPCRVVAVCIVWALRDARARLQISKGSTWAEWNAAKRVETGCKVTWVVRATRNTAHCRVIGC